MRRLQVAGPVIVVLLAGAVVPLGLSAAVAVVLGCFAVVATYAVFGASSDRVAYFFALLFMLTIAWNGVRAPGGSIANIFLAFGVLTVVFNAVTERRTVPFPPWLGIAALGFFLAAMLALVFPPSISLAGRSTIQNAIVFQEGGLPYTPPSSDIKMLMQFEIALLAIPLLIVLTATTRERLTRLSMAFVVSTTVSAAVGILDIAGFHSLAAGPLFAGNRSWGLAFHPNYLAITCDFAMPLALIQIGHTRRRSLAAMASVVILLGGEYASGSRAGTVSIVFAIVATTLAVPRLRARALIILPALGVAAVAIAVITGTAQDILAHTRLNGNPLTTEGSNAARHRLRVIAFEQFHGRPIQGVGMHVADDAHNIYLQLVASGGLIAASAFAVFITGLFQTIRRAVTGPHRDLAIAGGVAIITWLSNGFAMNQLIDRHLYVVPGLILAAAHLTAARSPSAEPARLRLPMLQAPAATRSGA
jgi:hypothetical protein